MASNEDTLVGKFFHTTHELGWQGQIVSEPRPGWYLIETYDWFVGEIYDHLLYPIERLEGWHIYTSAEEMRLCYDAQVSREWERAREKSVDA